MRSIVQVNHSCRVREDEAELNRDRWRKTSDDVWSCALYGRIISLRQDASHLFYRAIYPPIEEAPSTPPVSVPPSIARATTERDDTGELVRHYLNLQPNLAYLYSQWSTADTNFRKKAPKFTGVRILRQDAWEALIGFICSSNNNIVRISQMVEKLCTHYGRYIGSMDGQKYHDFPLPLALTGSEVESHLRELGFGYRAKFIHRTAVIVAEEHEMGWLDSLRNPESRAAGPGPAPAGDMRPEGRGGYRQAHESLLGLQGVGPKVADCVCLMGLGWGEAVPVDTHVWQIAQRDYKFGKGKHISLTKTTYDAVANHFRKLWGKEAGWAHSVLFTADLKVFSERLTAQAEVKQQNDEQIKGRNDRKARKALVEKPFVQKVRVKRKSDDYEDKKIVQIDEIPMTTSERVKRRRG